MLPWHVAVDHGVGIHKAQRYRGSRRQHGDLQRVQQRFDPDLFTEKLDIPCQPWDQDNAELRINDEDPQQANHHHEGQHQGRFTYTTWKVISEIWGAQKLLFFEINRLWKRP